MASRLARALPLEGIRDNIIGPVSHLSVSNFVPMCEIKALYAKSGAIARRSDASQRALNRGTAVHAALDTDSKFVEIPPDVSYRSTIEYGLKLMDTARRWEQLSDHGNCREVPLYGQVRGIKLYGVCDGIADHVLVENKTTARMPPQEWKLRLALHQALVYHYLLEQMRSPGFDVLPYIQRTTPEAACDEMKGLYGFTMQDAYESCASSIQRMCGVGISNINLVYTSFGSKGTTQTYEFNVDLETRSQLLQSASDMWAGDREPIPVRSDGAFSCKYCEYNTICEFVKRWPNALE